MNTAETARLRAQIIELDAQGLDKLEIVDRLGCARSTVYKVLAKPGPDRRHSPAPSAASIPAETVAAIKELADSNASLSAPAIRAILLERGDAPPVPSESTVARLLKQGSAQSEAELDTSINPAPRESLLPAYSREAARAHYLDLEPETALLRALVREAVAELDRPDSDPRHRDRRREHVASLVLMLMRGSRMALDCGEWIPPDAYRESSHSKTPHSTVPTRGLLNEVLSTSR